MPRLSRVPGNFSHTSLGRSKHARTGWQRFRLLDSEHILQEPSGTANPLDSITENATTTTVVYKTTHNVTLDQSPMIGFVSGKPLRDSDGRLLTFADCFSLRIRLENISLSGDYTDATVSSTTDKTKPQILFGVCANSNFDDTTNKHIGMGFRNRARSSSGEDVDGRDPRFLSGFLESDGDGFSTTTNSSGDDGTNLFEAQIAIGPDLDAAANTLMVFQQYGDAGENFDVASGNSAAFQSKNLSVNQGNFGTNQVFLFVAVSDCNNVSGASTACTYQFRCSYMVEAATFEDGGFGTS